METFGFYTTSEQISPGGYIASDVKGALGTDIAPTWRIDIWDENGLKVSEVFSNLDSQKYELKNYIDNLPKFVTQSFVTAYSDDSYVIELRRHDPKCCPQLKLKQKDKIIFTDDSAIIYQDECGKDYEVKIKKCFCFREREYDYIIKDDTVIIENLHYALNLRHHIASREEVKTLYYADDTLKKSVMSSLKKRFPEYLRHLLSAEKYLFESEDKSKSPRYRRVEINN